MALNPFNPRPKPDAFWRVTDEQPFIKFDPEQGFRSWVSTEDEWFNRRITPASVRDHLLRGNACEWKGLISLCGTKEKVESEKDWRVNNRYPEIRVYEIDTADLSWASALWDENQNIRLSYLTDAKGDVMIFKAMDLIEQFGLQQSLEPEIISAAEDEWLALEWIPASMIVRLE